ncbi:putative polypeptide chain release factor methylase [Spiroplasma syrphidicola EA-1]|uniref:Putative polypeptide chain release factor methylase n=1 Tax=Spiroplasma syrphidicola EA-1 TaxID=1276229 RepID=R4U518_9MOLU|nr:hypothetical protein [Spiroplasma syrphidicola]AGM25633.1 putative polypeptide chain release factor methylase [Spiroplasma syrphidicola EA-1]
MDTKIRNAKKWKLIVKAYLLVLAVMIPFFIFMYVSHTNSVLKNYFNFIEETPNEILNIFTTSKLPGRLEIFSFSYVALAITCASFFLPGFYLAAYDVRNNRGNNKMILVGTLSIIVFLFVASFMFSMSEYAYDKVYEWCHSLRGGYNGPEFVQNIENMIPTDLPGRDALIQKLANLATGPGTNNVYPLRWMGVNTVWWITGIQTVIILYIILKLGFRLERLFNTNINLAKNEELVVLKDTFNQGAARKILSLFLIPNEFNISLWIIICSAMVFTPQVIYTFKINLSFTAAHQFILFSFLYPFLTRNAIIPGTTSSLEQPNVDYYDVMSKSPGDWDLIFALPIIVIALITTLLLGFAFIMINKPNISKIGFISLYIGFLVIGGISLTAFLVSQNELNSVIDFWNSQSDHFKDTVMKPLFGTTKIDYFWLHGNELIASAILSFSFIFALLAIGISHILKIKQGKIIAPIKK